MFKGYVKTKNKKPLEKLKGVTTFHTWDEIQELNHDYGGVLNDDIIQIDVDESEEALLVQNIITTLKLKSNILRTSRGLHFYFRNPGIERRKIKKQNAIGVTVDIALGTHNACVPLRIDGAVREWVEQHDEIDMLPVWLGPIDRLEINWADMEEGDGRNQALFNYILKLQSKSFSKDQIKETIRVINKFVLKNELSDREVDVILRDESFKKQSFFIKNQFQHDIFADFIKAEEHIIRLDGQLYIYKDGVYKYDKRYIQSAMIRHLKKLKTTQRNEVMNYLEIRADEKEMAHVQKIGVANGILDLETMEVEAFDPKHILTNKIPVSYNPDAYNKHVDHVLNRIVCDDAGLRSLIEEMIGYCLLRRNEIGKAFILTGGGSNGKSTLLNMIKKLIGHENISSLGLNELDDRFKTAELVGRLVNIGDDISSEYIKDDSTFKKLTTGEALTVERKGKDPFDFENYAKLIFSANEIPRINDRSDGLKRRLLLVPFNARFTKDDDDYDPFIIDKVTTNAALEYLLVLALDGLKRLLENRKFTDSKSVQKQLDEYEMINNPILEFFEELDEGDILGNQTADVYKRYSVWCLENSFKPFSKIQFSREVCKYFSVESKPKKVKGKLLRLYEKE